MFCKRALDSPEPEAEAEAEPAILPLGRGVIERSKEFLSYLIPASTADDTLQCSLRTAPQRAEHVLRGERN